MQARSGFSKLNAARFFFSPTPWQADYPAERPTGDGPQPTIAIAAQTLPTFAQHRHPQPQKI